MNTWHVARFTFHELVRSKIMWNIPVLGAMMALVTYVAREFTYGAPGRVATDLGLAALTLCTYGIAFFAGSNMIRTEADSRTIYLIISRPVSRTAFLAGKVAGVGVFLLLNILCLGGLYLALMASLGTGLSPEVLTAVAFLLLEAMLLLVVLVLISMVANLALTLIFGAVLLIAGHAVAVSHDILWLNRMPWLKEALRIYDWVFPAFHRLSFKNYAVHPAHFPWDMVLPAAGYGVLYSAAVFGLACVVINRKNFD